MKNWWERRALRFRLSLWYGVGGTLLLAAFSATLYIYVARTMARPLDHRLRRDLSEVRQRLEVRNGNQVFWNGREIRRRTQWTTEYPWFELWNEDGTLVRRFWPLTENRIAHVPTAPVRGRETISVYNVAPDLRLRSLSVPYRVPDQEADWMIRLIRLHEPVADALGALGVIIVVSLPIVITLLVIGGYMMTRRWLLPLDRMAVEADLITAEDLSRRLPVANPHDELGRLAAVFNDTLDRLKASFDALDRFVADASHELRTPLTTLRSVGEVGLRRDRTAEEYREIIASMLEESQRLQLLVERLLELASAEGGAPPVHRSEVVLDEYVAMCAAELSILAEAKHQQLTVETSSRCTVMTDPVIFRQALQNLVDNAIKYGPSNSTVRIIVLERGDSVCVAVTDEGAGIPAEDRAHLTKRFFRPGRGRGGNNGGFGLGLSITKAYMRVLGGSFEYEPLHPHGSTFRLVLPRKKAAVVATG